MHFMSTPVSLVNKAAIQDAFHEHTSELGDCMKDKVWSQLKRELQDKLVNSVKTNLRYNKHTVPRDQVNKRRVKVKCVVCDRPHPIKFILIFRTTIPPREVWP